MGKHEELTESELRLKISSYCAYQERSPKQVLEKLAGLTSNNQLIEDVYEWATKENFVSEHRFAENYAQGKFRLKKWGKFKIREGLRSHNLNDAIISKALDLIDKEEYESTILNLGKRKMSNLDQSDIESWIKVKRYLIGKGFEADLVNNLKKEIKE